MKMIILNGSPKGWTITSNTQLLIEQFTSGMKTKCEERWVSKENPEELVKVMQDFETILFVMPLYIHAMPSDVMRLIEHMTAAAFRGKKLGFFIQSGFPEGLHGKYVKEYLEVLTQKLDCHYLGTIVKGDCAFIYKNLKGYTKVFEMVKTLGSQLEETGQFDEQLVEQLGQPYQFSKSLLIVLKIFEKTGLINNIWKSILKENGALNHALDRPFL